LAYPPPELPRKHVLRLQREPDGGSEDSNLGAIRVKEATSNITFRADGDLISLGRSTSTVSLLDGFYGAITSCSGTKSITVGANAKVRSVGFSCGVDIVTVRASVERPQR